MGQAKHQYLDELEAAEYAQRRKVAGYTKMLENEGRLAGHCWYCEGGLSAHDHQETECIHCGYSHPWNRPD